MWIGSILAVECGVQTQYSYSEKKYRSKYQLLHGLCVTNCDSKTLKFVKEVINQAKFQSFAKPE